MSRSVAALGHPVGNMLARCVEPLATSSMRRLTLQEQSHTNCEMRSDKSKRGFVRPMSQHKDKRQIEALRAAGVGAIYVVGKNCETWMDMTKALRPGDHVMVEALALIAEPKGPAVRWPSQDMRDALEEIERRGAIVIETHTGRRSDNAEQRRAMIADAVRALGAGQRALPSDVARANGAKGGRRAKQFAPDVIEKARVVWESRKHKTYKDAAKALPKGFSMMRAFRMFGPRG